MLVCTSLLFSLMVGELALRLLGFSYPSFHIYDDITGTALRPGAQGWYREEGEAYVRINSAGMRDDREIAPDKPPSTFRIAVVGDSFTEALQVPTGDTFVALLERTLKSCPALRGRTIETLNFGVSGNSTAQELLTVQTRVWPFKPDVVLLQFLAGNDIRDNSRRLSGNYPRPFFNLESGALVADTSFRNTTIARMKSSMAWKWSQSASDYSRLVQLLNKIKNIVGQPLSAPPARQAQSGVRQLGLDDAIYVAPTDDAWTDAWAVTERLLVATWREATQHGARFLLVDITNGVDVHPDASLRRKYMDTLGIQSLGYPHERVEKFARREGIPFVGLWPSFAAYAQKNSAYLHGFPNTGLGSGHWNKSGHALAAENISTRICADVARW